MSRLGSDVPHRLALHAPPLVPRRVIQLSLHTPGQTRATRKRLAAKQVSHWGLGSVRDKGGGNGVGGKR
ncbi:hypothetical protein E2C01_043570 [Portunus trituberculatus]|uniref:Uncharacterized protein n=1 Tax=Portunus trituberculatus TaxID=210409 RepID=A0A5B7FXX3_PORTR|nr:hypothetical protein [Portunus trituberculatus]